MRLPLLLCVLAVTGCQPSAEVDLTVLAEPLTAVESSSIATLTFDISGAATAHGVRRLTRPFQNGAENIVFSRHGVSGRVVIQVAASDAEGLPVAAGSVTVDMVPRAIRATVTLQRQLRALGSACRDTSQCQSGGCVNGFCGCRDDNDCAAGQYCETVCKPWSPSVEPGLVLWLDPDTGLITTDGVQVDRWADRSGQVSSATGFGPPSVLPNALAGHSVVHFDGKSYLYLGDPFNLRWGTGPFVIEMVVRYTGSKGGAGAALYQKTQYQVDPYPGPGLFTEDPYFVDHEHDIVGQVDNGRLSTGHSSNDNQWRIVGLRRFAKGTQLVVRVNGQNGSIDVKPQDRPLVDVSNMGMNATIGGREDGKQDLIGDIAEVIAVRSDESDPLPLRIEQYLKSKYGL